MNKCLHCESLISTHASKFCSNQCQNDYAYATYISSWRLGQRNGARGIATKNLSNHVTRYILEKYKHKCARCGWHEANPNTGRVYLEIDHIDGNSENNSERNLILLCPNCHSLTSTYKNLNKGNGRRWRREKYVKIS